MVMGYIVDSSRFEYSLINPPQALKDGVDDAASVEKTMAALRHLLVGLGQYKYTKYISAINQIYIITFTLSVSNFVD